MLVIGLTGGIGTGKSEVSRILKGLGASIIDADRLGHESYRPHTQVRKELVEAFGDDIVRPDGEIDRKRLGVKVFNDPSARATLNRIVHPRIANMIKDHIKALRNRGQKVAVVEAAILIEAGWDSVVDEVWVTSSPEDAVIDRLRARDNLSDNEIRSRIRSQMPANEKVSHGDVVLVNSGSIDDLRTEVESIWNDMVRKVS